MKNRVPNTTESISHNVTGYLQLSDLNSVGSIKLRSLLAAYVEGGHSCCFSENLSFEENYSKKQLYPVYLPREYTKSHLLLNDDYRVSCLLVVDNRPVCSPFTTLCKPEHHGASEKKGVNEYETPEKNNNESFSTQDTVIRWKFEINDTMDYLIPFNCLSRDSFLLFSVSNSYDESIVALGALPFFNDDGVLNQGLRCVNLIVIQHAHLVGSSKSSFNREYVNDKEKKSEKKVPIADYNAAYEAFNYYLNLALTMDMYETIPYSGVDQKNERKSLLSRKGGKIKKNIYPGKYRGRLVRASTLLQNLYGLIPTTYMNESGKNNSPCLSCEENVVSINKNKIRYIHPWRQRLSDELSWILKTVYCLDNKKQIFFAAQNTENNSEKSHYSTEIMPNEWLDNEIRKIANKSLNEAFSAEMDFVGLSTGVYDDEIDQTGNVWSANKSVTEKTNKLYYSKDCPFMHVKNIFSEWSIYSMMLVVELPTLKFPVLFSHQLKPLSERKGASTVRNCQQIFSFPSSRIFKKGSVRPIDSSVWETEALYKDISINSSSSSNSSSSFSSSSSSSSSSLSPSLPHNNCHDKKVNADSLPKALKPRIAFNVFLGAWTFSGSCYELRNRQTINSGEEDGDSPSSSGGNLSYNFDLSGDTFSYRQKYKSILGSFYYNLRGPKISSQITNYNEDDIKSPQIIQNNFTKYTEKNFISKQTGLPSSNINNNGININKDQNITTYKRFQTQNLLNNTNQSSSHYQIPIHWTHHIIDHGLNIDKLLVIEQLSNNDIFSSPSSNNNNNNMRKLEDNVNFDNIFLQLLDPYNIEKCEEVCYWHQLSHKIQLKPRPVEIQLMRKCWKLPRPTLDNRLIELHWKYRLYLLQFPCAMPKFLACVDWFNTEQRQHALMLVHLWAAPNLNEILELLGGWWLRGKENIGNNSTNNQNIMNDNDNGVVLSATLAIIRRYAIKALQNVEDFLIELYLLQLVQLVRYDKSGSVSNNNLIENNTNQVGFSSTAIINDNEKNFNTLPAMAAFLISKALTNKSICTRLYWFLKCECEDESTGHLFVRAHQRLVKVLRSHEEHRELLSMLENQAQLRYELHEIFKRCTDFRRDRLEKKTYRLREAIERSSLPTISLDENIKDKKGDSELHKEPFSQSIEKLNFSNISSQTSENNKKTLTMASLPIDPSYSLVGVIPNECTVVRSNTYPLILSFLLSCNNHNQTGLTTLSSNEKLPPSCYENNSSIESEKNLQSKSTPYDKLKDLLSTQLSTGYSALGNCPHCSALTAGTKKKEETQKAEIKTINSPTSTKSFAQTQEMEVKKYLYKVGDDLRQDQLVIQLITIMDIVLRSHGLDLKLTPYKVLAFSTADGLIEFVSRAEPFSTIKKTCGLAEFLRTPVENDKPIAREVGTTRESSGQSSEQNSTAPTPISTTVASTGPGIDYPIDPGVLETFIRSCAGYSVITYILGVGDRHLDNLLMTRDGRFFHIDFAYIFGQDPKPFPPPMKLCKEMVDLMGGINSTGYNRFCSFCCEAFLILRQNCVCIVEALYLLKDASVKDILIDAEAALSKVVEKLRIDLSDDQAESYLLNVINVSVRALSPVVVDKLHEWALYWK